MLEAFSSRAGGIRKGQPSMDSAERPRAARTKEAYATSVVPKSFGRLGRFALWLVLVLAIAGSLSIATFGGTNLARAAIEKAKSLAELINQRSPGQRTKGVLTKIKHKRARPHERALPKVVLSLNFPPFVNEPALVDVVGAPPALVPAAFDTAPPPFTEAPPPTSGPPTILPPGEGLPVGPPIVSQPPPPSPPPPNLPPPNSPPPVPEPSTWMTMLLGFFLLGSLVRRDSKRLLVN